MRPLPGRSRMYPETDVPPRPLTHATWAHVLGHLPMSDEERSTRLSSFDISKDQGDQLLARELRRCFLRTRRHLTSKGLGGVVVDP